MSTAVAVVSKTKDLVVRLIPLATRTKRIKELMLNWAENTIDMGRELRAVRDERFPPLAPSTEKYRVAKRTSSAATRHRAASINRPGWAKYLKELGISAGYARGLIRVADKFGSLTTTPKLSGKMMILLSNDDVPETARQDAVARAERGETITHKKAGKIIHGHQLPADLPKPAEANKKAAEDGKAYLASDGNIYFGTSKEDAQAGSDRRTIVYGVRDAIQTLAEVSAGIKDRGGMTAENFLKYAAPWQLWRGDTAQQIDTAKVWLDDLASEWAKR